MASANFMQRVGKSSCIRCEFETDESMSFEAQAAAMTAHLEEKHPNWLSEPLTAAQQARLDDLLKTLDQRRIEELEKEFAALRR